MASGNDTGKKQKLEDGTGAADENKPSTSSLPRRGVQELMPSYYAKLFPVKHMFKWLAYGNDSRHAQADATFFNRREFCFTLDGDIFVRYQAFKDGNALADAIRQRCPSKIDIGPVYTASPQDRFKFGASFQPVERELVFDIDLTDYDDVRTCGKEGHICSKCWPLMAVAVKIIDAGLREEFGFKHILWVYSGRRGIHCWVCDSSARQLADDQRSAIVNWFAVCKGQEEGRMKVALLGSEMHPAVQRAQRILAQNWESVLLPAQRLLEDGPMCEAMLKYIPEEALVDSIRKKWADDERAAARKKDAPKDINVTRWQALVKEVERRVEEERSRKPRANYKVLGPLETACDRIMMAHAYPRLDMEVSKKMNHLLKAPFCVHPKTGKVCVPLDPQRCESFDPDGVPTVHSLLEELGAAGGAAAAAAAPAASTATAAAAAAGSSGMDTDDGQARAGDVAAAAEPWRSTEMGPAVQLFERCLLSGLAAANKDELATRTRVAVAVSQMNLDF